MFECEQNASAWVQPLGVGTSVYSAALRFEMTGAGAVSRGLGRGLGRRLG